MDLPIPKIPHDMKNRLDSSRLTSIWGDFGVGKTTLAIQTVLAHFKEKKGKILYFYTKPNFPMNKIQQYLGSDKRDLMEKFTEMFTLITISDFRSLRKALMNLELVITRSKNQKNRISLIVIDSITDLYKLEIIREKKEKNASINYLLNLILGTLFYLSITYDLEIVIVNELVHRKKGEEISEVQSGGKVTNFWTSLNIKVERTSILNNRKVIFYDQNYEKLAEFDLFLTKKGFSSEK
ncbi:MAG: hypothetical protein GF383_02875 [Candidatus Lokiarchaeota archaeon]|nr:hypothetical protein [Candidatus Lokiarchaeota archaeon]MBD3338458.1 hypothetical protein [Candidatus Lokiarchaeota archaeon]